MTSPATTSLLAAAPLSPPKLAAWKLQLTPRDSAQRCSGASIAHGDAIELARPRARACTSKKKRLVRVAQSDFSAATMASPMAGGELAIGIDLGASGLSKSLLLLPSSARGN